MSPEHSKPQGFFGFYGSVLKEAITGFFDAKENWEKAMIATLTIIAYFSKDIAQKLRLGWEGLSRWWALVPIAVLLLIRLLKGNYERFEEAIKREQNALAESETLRKEVRELKDDLRLERDRNHPNFLIEIHRYVAFPGQPQIVRELKIPHQVDSMAGIEVAISNAGLNSVADKWNCELELGDRSKHRPVFFNLTGAGQLNLHGADGGPLLVLTATEFIQTTLLKALPTGERAVGWIFVMFSGVSVDQLKQPTSRLAFDFRDVTNKLWTFEYRPSGVLAKQLKHTPGGAIPL